MSGNRKRKLMPYLQGVVSAVAPNILPPFERSGFLTLDSSFVTALFFVVPATPSAPEINSKTLARGHFKGVTCIAGFFKCHFVRCWSSVKYSLLRLFQKSCYIHVARCQQSNRLKFISERSGRKVGDDS